MEQGYAHLARVTVGSVLPKAAVSATYVSCIKPSTPLIPPFIQKDPYYISTFSSVHQVDKAYMMALRKLDVPARYVVTWVKCGQILS